MESVKPFDAPDALMLVIVLFYCLSFLYYFYPYTDLALPTNCVQIVFKLTPLKHQILLLKAQQI